MSLTKEQILAANDRVLKEVKVPEWGGSVWVRSLDVPEQISFEEECGATEGTEHATLVSLSFWMSDAKGNRLFTLEDIKGLRKKNSVVIARVFRAGLDLNRPMADKVVEAELKNS